MKAALDKAYFWDNKTYLPGSEVEIPDDLAKAIGLNSESPDVEEKSDSEEKPSGASKSKPKTESKSE